MYGLGKFLCLTSPKGFPNDPIFTQLRQYAIDRPETVIHDDDGIDASYGSLLEDVARLRRAIQKRLPRTWLNKAGVLKQENTAFGVILSHGYYFIVSFLAIASLGGVTVPMGTAVLPPEGIYFLRKCNAEFIVAEEETFETAVSIRNHSRKESGKGPTIIKVTKGTYKPGKRLELQIDENLSFSPSAGCLILYTSGTTGPPKGILLPRRLFYFSEKDQCPNNVYLSTSAVHWLGGATGLLYSVLTGETLHAMKYGYGPDRLWKVLREGRITHASLGPSILRTMMKYYEDHIAQLPFKEREEYISGLQSLEAVFVSGAVLDSRTRKFFTALSNVPLTVAYGLTELGGGAMITSPTTPMFPERCIGSPMKGITVKLSEGDSGEILVKSPTMFLGYVNDDAATRAAFDKDGFFRTGDRAYRDGDNNYFFEGRMTSDWVRFHERRISILQVEQDLMGLPYITETYALAVPDHGAGGLVGALIRISEDEKATQVSSGKITLRDIRQDLASRNIPAYQFPALLRVLREGEEIPTTVSGKPVKREILKKFFNISGYLPEPYEEEGVEYWGNEVDETAPTRIVDWGDL